MKTMKQLRLLCVLFRFLCWNTISLEGTWAETGYTEVEVKDGGTIVGNVKYMGDITTLSLNLCADWEVSETPKPATEKFIVNMTNSGIKYAVVSITDITKGKKKTIPPIHPIIDQQMNTFIPRVTAILLGTTIDI